MSDSEFYSNEAKVLSIIPRVAGCFSIVGSAYILRELIKDRKAKLYDNKMLSNRILFCVCGVDILYTMINYVVGNLMAPKGSTYGSLGNTQTCTAQGFMVQFFGVSTIFYNACLAVSYVLIVKYNLKGEKIARIQYLLVVLPWILGTIFSIPPLYDNAYNLNPFVACYLWTYPFDCIPEGSDEVTSLPVCERGNRYKFYLLYFSDLPLGFVLVVILICMVVLFHTVLQRDQAMDRFQFDGTVNRKQSKEVAMTGLLYIWIYLLTWVGPFTATIFILTKGEYYSPLWLKVTLTVLGPSQGTLNVLIYLRPKNSAQIIENRIASVHKFVSARTIQIFSQKPHTIPQNIDKVEDEVNRLENSKNKEDIGRWNESETDAHSNDNGIEKNNNNDKNITYNNEISSIGDNYKVEENLIIPYTHNEIKEKNNVDKNIHRNNNNKTTARTKNIKEEKCSDDVTEATIDLVIRQQQQQQIIYPKVFDTPTSDDLVDLYFM